LQQKTIANGIETYCSRPFLSGMTACSMHIKSTRVTSQNYWLPPSLSSQFVTNLVTFLPLGCDVIYGRPLHSKSITRQWVTAVKPTALNYEANNSRD